MAERCVLTVSTKPRKTQEYMRAKLEEWRKAKQQRTADQLKQQTAPMKTANTIKPKISIERNTSIKQNSKISLSSKHSSAYKKKSFTASQIKINTDENKIEDPCQTFNNSKKHSNANFLKRPAALQPHMDKSLSMRERLELWRKEKGKTPGITKTPATIKRKRKSTMTRTNHQPIVMEALESLQLESFETMNCDLAEKECTPEETKEKLQEFLEKLQKDKSNDEIIATQLDVIQKSHPGALLCAEFWICRAKIAEHEEDEGRVVCLYEQALVFNAEPEQLIKEAFAAYSKKRKGPEESPPITEEDMSNKELIPSQHQTNPVTPFKEEGKTKQAGHPSPMDSSIIMYSVTKATPYKKRMKSCERPVLTPVRRSTRLEKRSVHYPTMLQEHGLAIRHLEDLPEDIQKDVVFKPNFTVKNDLNEAWKDLWEGMR